MHHSHVPEKYELCYLPLTEVSSISSLDVLLFALGGWGSGIFYAENPAQPR